MIELLPPECKLNEISIDLNQTFPIQMNVPVNLPIKTEVIVPIDMLLPIALEVPVQMDVPIDIAIEETPFGDYLQQLSNRLRQGLW
jgi:hypothetical protein